METNVFEHMSLSEELQRAVRDTGFEQATTIQSRTMPLILEGKDVMGQSHTGSGKTAAFVLPALERIDPSRRDLQVLILCPTRELAVQCNEEIRRFTRYTEGIRSLAVYGGEPIGHQIKALKKGVQIVAGTPGRIMDHMNRRTLKTGGVSMVVLDEADEMLRMGFREDIETILSGVPENRQTLLFSATMPREILRISGRYQKNPVKVTVGDGDRSVPDIQQFYYQVPGREKIGALDRLLRYHKASRSLVFCNTRKMVDQISDVLEDRGFCVRGIHGEIPQNTRTRIMRDFKAGRVDILVATDVAARGIDVENVDAVYNFDLPQTEEFYTHRIGRTGRAGRQGAAHTLVSGRNQIGMLRDIGRKGKTAISQARIPAGADGEQPVELQPVRPTAVAVPQERYLNQAEKLIRQGADPVELAARLLQELDGKKNRPTSYTRRNRPERKHA